MEDMHAEAPSIHEINTEINSLLLNIHEVITRLFLGIKQGVLYMVALLCTLQLFLWLSIFLYVGFYYIFMPSAKFSTPVHFYYSSDYCSFPVANFSLLQNGKKQVMAHSQPYRFILQLEMPESPANMQLGLFLVRMSCYSHNGEIVNTSVRSTMLRYRSGLLQTLETVMFIPLMLMGAIEQKQHILVELYSSYTDSSHKPTIGAIIEIQSQQVQIYKAQLCIYAHFSGIRYVLYYFPLTAAVVGVINNFIFLSVLFLFTYLGNGLGSIWRYQQYGQYNKFIEDEQMHRTPEIHMRSTHAMKKQRRTDAQKTRNPYEKHTHNEETNAGTKTRLWAASVVGSGDIMHCSSDKIKDFAFDTELEDKSNDLKGFSKQQSLSKVAG